MPSFIHDLTITTSPSRSNKSIISVLFFVALSPAVARRKVAHLLRHFGSQRSRAWFSERTFMGLMQLRAVECRATSGYAEAFYARKLVL